MIWAKLKKLRKEKGFSLSQLDENCWIWVWNLSNYENEKIKASDQTLEKILVKGYGFWPRESLGLIGQWRTEELNKNYNLKIAQEAPPFNPGQKISLEEFLKKMEGFSEEEAKILAEKIKSLKSGN